MRSRSCVAGCDQVPMDQVLDLHQNDRCNVQACPGNHGQHHEWHFIMFFCECLYLYNLYKIIFFFRKILHSGYFQ